LKSEWAAVLAAVWVAPAKPKTVTNVSVLIQF